MPLGSVNICVNFPDSVLKLYEPNSGFFFESFSEGDTSELDAEKEGRNWKKLLIVKHG